MPIERALRCAVVITRETEGEQREPDRRVAGLNIGCAMGHVLHIGCVLPIFHPDAFIQREMVA